MSDATHPDKLLSVLNSLHRGTSAERDAALQHLFALANTVAVWPEDETLSQSEQLELYGAARDQFFNRPQIAAALIQAMQDPSVRLRGTTALTLGSVRSRQAEETLIHHLLTDPADHVRIMCCAALRFSHEPHIVDAFILALEDSQDKVVYPACMALGESGYLRAVPPLQKVLGHPVWNVRYHAAEALVQLGTADASLVALIEELAAQPAAQNHDEIVTRSNSFAEEIGEPGRTLTTWEVLEQARQLAQ